MSEMSAETCIWHRISQKPNNFYGQSSLSVKNKQTKKPPEGEYPQIDTNLHWQKTKLMLHLRQDHSYDPKPIEDVNKNGPIHFNNC